MCHPCVHFYTARRIDIPGLGWKLGAWPAPKEHDESGFRRFAELAIVCRRARRAVQLATEQSLFVPLPWNQPRARLDEEDDLLSLMFPPEGTQCVSEEYLCRCF
jgi:hypothetical protein